MAISFQPFFTRFGTGVDVIKKLLASSGGTTDTEYQEFVDAFDSDALDIKQSLDTAITSLRNMQGGVSNAAISMLVKPAQNLLIEYVQADRPTPNANFSDSLDEFLYQMEYETVDSLARSVIGSSQTPDGGNTGDGEFLISTKYPNGTATYYQLAETIRCLITKTDSVFGTGTVKLLGQRSRPRLDYRWPAGSGISASKASKIAASSGNLIPNGGLETADTDATTQPDDWIGTVTTGTVLSDIEIQTVIISGTPTSGTYTLRYTDAGSNIFETLPIAYDASQGVVQSALRTLTPLAEVTVVTTGTSPNYTHTITFTGTTNPTQLTSTDAFDTGSIAHATTTAGNANVVRGARSLVHTGDAASLMTYHIPITLPDLRQYACGIWVKTSGVSAGVLRIALVDGVGGTVVDDDEGTANSASLTLSTASSWTFLSTSFRTPTNAPASMYVQLKCTTAVTNTGLVYMDEFQMFELKPLYTGGPSAMLFTGPTPWDVNDTIDLAYTNDRAGSMNDWMDRIFNIRDRSVSIPTAAIPTILESVIS